MNPMPFPAKNSQLTRGGQLVDAVLRCLILDPTGVEVSELHGDDLVVLQLKLRPKELARIIGRTGRTADALRDLLAAVSGADDQQYILVWDVLEQGNCATAP